MFFRTFVSFVLMAAMFAVSPLNAQDEPSGSLAPGLKPSTIVDKPDEASLLDKSSFIIGYNTTARMLADMKQQGIGVNTESYLDGIKKAIAGEELGMSDEEVMSVMTAFQTSVKEKQIAKMKAMAEQNSAAGKAFMAENAKKEGVKALPNGVQYEVLTAGTGTESPTKADRVRVHYEGSLIDGKVFDSSLKPRGGGKPTPAEFGVTEVVPGFSAVLQAMKVGDRWRVVIPGELGYGVRGRAPIKPNEALVFTIELIDILK